MSKVRDFARALKQTLLARKTEEAITVQAEYRLILESIERGEQVDITKVESVVAKLGKTLDDLGPDAEHRARAKQEHAIYVQMPKHRADLARFEAELEALQQERSDFLAKMNERIIAVQQQVRAAELAVNLSDSAKRWLLDNCNDAALLERERQIANEQRNLLPQYNEQREAVHAAETRLAYHKSMIEGYDSQIRASKRQDSPAKLLTPSEIAALKRKIEEQRVLLSQAQAKLEAEQADLDAVNAKLSALRAEAEQLTQQKLNP